MTVFLNRMPLAHRPRWYPENRHVPDVGPSIQDYSLPEHQRCRLSQYLAILFILASLPDHDYTNFEAQLRSLHFRYTQLHTLRLLQNACEFTTDLLAKVWSAGIYTH